METHRGYGSSRETAAMDQFKVGLMGFLQSFWHTSWQRLQQQHIS